MNLEIGDFIDFDAILGGVKPYGINYIVADDGTYDEKVNGQYQGLAGGLQIRFSGDTADTATLNDKWEIEVYGRQEAADIGTPGSIRMTRRSKRVATWQ